MGEYKDINDEIYDDLISRLDEEGYRDIQLNTTVNNKIVDLIDARDQGQEEFEKLVSYSIKIIKEYI